MEKHKQTSSHWLFITYFLGCAVIIALLWPSVRSAHKSVVGERIQAARDYQKAGDLRKAENQFVIANTIRLGDTEPTKELAAFYAQQGRYQQAIATIKQLPFKQSYETLTTYEMKYQKWENAQSNLKRSVKINPTSDIYARLAIVQFNLDKVDDGCNNASSAVKKGLDNPAAIAATQACQLLKTDLTRGMSYQLVKIGVFTQPEKFLDSHSQNNAADLLLLAQIASGRGDNSLALERAEKAARLDPTNETINTFVALLASALGDKTKADTLKRKSEQLKVIEQY